MDYEETLLMAKTDFPMRGNLTNKEPIRREEWDRNNIYEKVQERSKGRPSFVLHDGPPYANGDLHIGHALNKVLKDFIVRYKSMSGYHAPYIPGRSEEHTSELQSRGHLVCRLLLEKTNTSISHYQE